MLIVTRGEFLRVRPAGASEERMSGPGCPEAQADGVPCDTVHADCERCQRALAREDGEPVEPAPAR